MLAALIVALLPSCHAEQPPLTEQELEDITAEWFLQKHGANAVVTGHSPLQVGEKTWFTRVNVTVQEDAFELVLNDSNTPVADNVDSLLISQKLIEQEQNGELESIKPCSDMDIRFFPSFTYVDRSYRYTAVCEVSMNTIPENSSNVAWRQFIQALNGTGLDNLWLSIVTPEFLRNHGRIQLTGKTFDAKDTQEDFNCRFSEFINSVHWDEQKFSVKLRELSDAGFSDPRFYVSGWASGTTLEIALSYETEEAG